MLQQDSLCFPLSGKSKNQIPCFPCAVATLTMVAKDIATACTYGKVHFKILITEHKQDFNTKVTERTNRAFIFAISVRRFLVIEGHGGVEGRGIEGICVTLLFSYTLQGFCFSAYF